MPNAGSNVASASGALVTPPPWTVKAIAAVMFLMALGAGVVLVWYALSLGTPGPVPMSGRIFFLVLLLAATGLAALSGFQILKSRPWTRAFVIVWHIFQIIFATQLLIGPTWWIALLLLIPSALAVILMFAKATTDFFASNLGFRNER